jgi:ribosomal protein S18 acetylase RimI-like enzyme
MKAAILNKNDLNIDIKEQVSELFRQLSPNKIQLDLEEILNEKNQITVAYCEDNNKIIGIALMCIYKVISGNKGWIEDVVVDSASRGKGVGRKLINLLVEVGEEKELSEMLLFTEEHRLAAINLYSSVGFKLKDSKIYCKKNNKNFAQLS